MMARQSPPDGLCAVLFAHRGEVIRFLCARTGDPGEAEDVYQDLWIRLLHVRPGPIGNPRAYVFRAANNLVLDRRRAALRNRLRDGHWLAEEAPGDRHPEERADPAIAPDDALALQQELTLLRIAMAALPAGALRALRLHRIDGLSHAEVAATMQISRSGVEKHMAVAMKHLRRALANCGVGGAAASDNLERPGSGEPLVGCKDER